MIEGNEIDFPRAEQASDVNPLEHAELGPDIGFTEVDITPIADFFGVERPDSSELDRINQLFDWARQHGIRDRGEMIAELSKIERKLGSPALGESRLSQVYRWIQLDGQIGSLIREQKAYERGE